MAKKKKYFVCTNCGYITYSWLGKCPECGSWNSFEEFVDDDKTKKNDGKQNQAIPLKDFLLSEREIRIKTEVEEIDRVLGGGFVKSSLVLIGGEPGIGKSTLMLQLSKRFAKKYKVLYVSGEESIKQLKLRSIRLGADNSDLMVLAENELSAILENANGIKPEIMIIDSIQTIFNHEIASTRGTVNQIKDSTIKFLEFAKTTGSIVILVGHIVKSGDIAGPKILEHLVDVVLYFEGDKQHYYRIIRSVKNRFGSINEIGVFEMTSKGLIEIKNPSTLFMDKYNNDSIGSVLSTVIEGNRSFIVEVQALVSRSNFGVPQRVSRGYDNKKLALLIAVIEKHLDFLLGNHDIFINIVGGLKTNDPAIDMAIVVAIISSYKNIILKKNSVFFGEIGLGGEIREVMKADIRLKEAARLGMKYAYSAYSKVNKINKLQVVNVHHIRELFKVFT